MLFTRHCETLIKGTSDTGNNKAASFPARIAKEDYIEQNLKTDEAQKSDFTFGDKKII